MNTRQFLRKQEAVQTHWNNLDAERRAKLFFRFCDRLEALFGSLGLVCQCARCHAVMTAEELDDNGSACIECGTYSVLTPEGDALEPMSASERRRANYCEALGWE